MLDHRPALQKLLRTVLATYLKLLDAITIPPSHNPLAPPQEPEYLQHLEWLRLNATNMAAAINELRPVQVRSTPWLDDGLYLSGCEALHYDY